MRLFKGHDTHRVVSGPVDSIDPTNTEDLAGENAPFAGIIRLVPPE